jgi:hypothetical protein
MFASFCDKRCSYSRLTDSSKGAARDSVSLISFLHCGQVIVGSAIASPENVIVVRARDGRA